MPKFKGDDYEYDKWPEHEINTITAVLFGIAMILLCVVMVFKTNY